MAHEIWVLRETVREHETRHEIGDVKAWDCGLTKRDEEVDAQVAMAEIAKTLIEREEWTGGWLKAMRYAEVVRDG